MRLLLVFRIEMYRGGIFLSERHRLIDSMPRAKVPFLVPWAKAQAYLRNNGKGWVERAGRLWWVKTFGVLRCAQDDSKNVQRQQQEQEHATATTTARTCNDNNNSKNMQRQRQGVGRKSRAVVVSEDLRVLRCAQDDGKNVQRQQQQQERATATTRTRTRNGNNNGKNGQTARTTARMGNGNPVRAVVRFSGFSSFWVKLDRAALRRRIAGLQVRPSLGAPESR